MPKATIVHKPAKPRPNGLIITAKNLPLPSYNAIHKLPHGLRQIAMQALLAAAAECAKKDGPDWFRTAVIDKGKKLKLSYG